MRESRAKLLAGIYLAIVLGMGLYVGKAFIRGREQARIAEAAPRIPAKAQEPVKAVADRYVAPLPVTYPFY